MKKLFPAAFLAALLSAAPGLAASQCAPPELRLCVLDSPLLDAPFVRPCAAARCMTENEAVFDYFAYEPSAEGSRRYARVDPTGEITGSMNASFGAIGPDGEMIYEALPVDLLGGFVYGREGRILFYTTPCTDACAGTGVELDPTTGLPRTY